MRPVQRRSTPRWKRTVGSPGKRRVSGPRRENGLRGRALSNRPTGRQPAPPRQSDACARSPAPALRGELLTEALQRDTVVERAGPVTRRRLAAAPRSRANCAAAREAGEIREQRGTNRGRSRASGWRRLPAATAYGLSGAASTAARQASSARRRRPEEGDAEVELDERALRVQSARRLRRSRESRGQGVRRRADSRLERVERREERRRPGNVALPVQGLRTTQARASASSRTPS